MKKITVTWVDGGQAIYPCESFRVEDGVLKLFQSKYPATDEPHRYIPLTSIRIWEVPS